MCPPPDFQVVLFCGSKKLQLELTFDYMWLPSIDMQAYSFVAAYMMNFVSPSRP